tara:strand:- start:708 stop:1343 length:636 start_codon:yes stop_codon:yes gene_type:complete
MKINEALIIGGALLAALVLSKGEDFSSSINRFFKKPSIPFMPLENKTINFIENFPQVRTFDAPPYSIKQTNVQLDNIMNIEEKQKDSRLNYLQNELNQVQNYTEQQESQIIKNLRSPEFDRIAPKNWNGINLLEKFDRDGNPAVSLFPDFRLLYTRENRDIILNQAQKEIAQQNIQQNIARATEYSNRQQTDIDAINEEYQTRFGGLLRYG